MNAPSPWLLLLDGLLIVLLVALLVPSRRARGGGSAPADGDAPAPIDRDDERHWLGGLIYNNPDDPHLLVPKRFGIGRSVNFGRPLGKLLLIGPLLLPLLTIVLRVLARP